jgi:hypothetical protein
VIAAAEVRRQGTHIQGDDMKKRMLFVALLIVASVASGGAQQGSTPPVSLSQLQREAAAVQGVTPSVTSIAPTTPTTSTAPPTTIATGATMAPVTIKSVDQLGLAVDGAYEKMKASFQELSSRVGDIRTPEEANTLITNAHESLRHYTEAARRYYQQMQTQRQVDLESDRNRVTAREAEARRIETDIKRARDEANSYGTQLDAAQQAALTLATKPESVDPARIRELGVLIDTLKQASDRATQRATRLEHEGRQRAKDGVESARESVNLGQRALYFDASDLASVEESAVLSEMIIESYASDFRLRSMREEEAIASTTRATRVGFDPEPPVRVDNGGNAATSLREQRDQADVSRFTTCVANGTRADECMRLVATSH